MGRAARAGERGRKKARADGRPGLNPVRMQARAPSICFLGSHPGHQSSRPRGPPHPAAAPVLPSSRLLGTCLDLLTRGLTSCAWTSTALGHRILSGSSQGGNCQLQSTLCQQRGRPTHPHPHPRQEPTRNTAPAGEKTHPKWETSRE